MIADVSGNDITTSSLAFCMPAHFAQGTIFILEPLLIYFVRARAKYNKALSQTLLPNCDA
jgi:hypothetical protein